MGLIARVLITVLVAGCGLLPAPAGADEEGAMHELAGFTVGYLPAGVGGQVTDFHTEWGGVVSASRVWERQLPDDGGYRVDLKVNVLRGDRLADLPAARAFLAEYHEQDPAEWDLCPFQHGDAPGQRTEGLVFWLVEPGLVVEVRLDPARFAEADLTATAMGVRRVEHVSPGEGGSAANR